MHRTLLTTSLAFLLLCSSSLAQTPEAPPAAPPQVPATPIPATTFPAVTLGVVTFLQYAAELHESDGYNAFDVTRGYVNIHARLSERIALRSTPDVRPTTDAALNQNLALRLEYASLDARVTDNVAHGC